VWVPSINLLTYLQQAEMRSKAFPHSASRAFVPLSSPTSLAVEEEEEEAAAVEEEDAEAAAVAGEEGRRRRESRRNVPRTDDDASMVATFEYDAGGE